MEENWDVNLVKDLTSIIKVNVAKFSRVLRTMEKAHQKQFIASIKEEINDCFTLFTEQTSFFASVHRLRNNCVKLCNLLHADMEPYDENLTLYEQKMLLQDRLRGYELKIVDRRDKYRAMVIKEIELCKFLGKTPIACTDREIPTKSSFDILTKQVEELEKEKSDLETQIGAVRRKILNILKEVVIQIDPDIEKLLASIDNASEPKNKKNLKALTDYYETLQQKRKMEERKELDLLKTTLNNLYEKCQIALKERTINIENIHDFELDIVQTEIKKLQDYWRTNKKMFTFHEKYVNKWTKLASLIEEAPKNSANLRYTDITNLSREICFLENCLMEDATEFETDHERPFTSFGQTMPEVIAKFHGTHGKLTFTEMEITKSLSSKVNENNLKTPSSPKRKKFDNSLGESSMGSI